jgi:UDP-N-acetylglucosamine diphosphorylase / glucose-1-phosphate thymidylyltransferase / UDP-N-acetylgalactosamine diphosphorylase / glucosamine-1-phosphate N-acetyltransferase / galactosamine-1-phosphate N-acetyltransferase
MNKIVFTEEFCQPENLFPFTLTRQVQDIRVGILTIRQKWEHALQMPSFDKYEDDYKDLDRSIKLHEVIEDDTVYLIHGNILPTPKLVKQVKKLKPGQMVTVSGSESVVYCISKKEVEGEHKIKMGKAIELDEALNEIRLPWNIFEMNGWAIRLDFEALTKGRKSQKLTASNKAVNVNNIFIEKGAQVEHCIVNATDGPIYIGKNAVVMEGSLLRGPLAICEGAVVKMGTKIYGATTIGPYCTVGGEIKNSVFFGNSNKAHDGYVGDSVIGEWCNMGAGTSNSNIKNNASGVIVYTPKGPVNVGLKCGMLMGDYSRTAINTSINTGTVIGVSANVYGNGLTPKHIPSFSWGSEGVQRYKFDKALADIENWKSLKGQTLTVNEKTILKHIFDHY